MGAKSFFLYDSLPFNSNLKQSGDLQGEELTWLWSQSCQTRPVCIFLYIFVYIITVACAFANVHNRPASSPLFSRNFPNTFVFSFEILANQPRAISLIAVGSSYGYAPRASKSFVEEVWEKKKESIYFAQMNIRSINATLKVLKRSGIVRLMRKIY